MNEFTNKPMDLIEFLRMFYNVRFERGQRELELRREDGSWKQAVEEIESGRLKPEFRIIALARYYNVLEKVAGEMLSPEQKTFLKLNSDKLN